MTERDVFRGVAADLADRERIGFANHGRPLLADEGGRDWLVEAYEEALDQAVYLKGALMARALDLGGLGSPGEPMRLAMRPGIADGWGFVRVSLTPGEGAKAAGDPPQLRPTPIDYEPRGLGIGESWGVGCVMGLTAAAIALGLGLALRVAG